MIKIALAAAVVVAALSETARAEEPSPLMMVTAEALTDCANADIAANPKAQSMHVLAQIIRHCRQEMDAMAEAASGSRAEDMQMARMLTETTMLNYINSKRGH